MFFPYTQAAFLLGMAIWLEGPSACAIMSGPVARPARLEASTGRRGFAAAAAEVAMRVTRSPKSKDKAVAMAVAQLFAGKQVASVADPETWVPDPVTGCYRPGNKVVEVDAAKLRAALLGPKA